MLDARGLLTELEHEIVSTEKLLDRVPAEKLKWQPHPKAMTLGQLALHAGTIPGMYASYADAGTTDVNTLVSHPEPENKEDILRGFKASVRNANLILSNGYGAWLNKSWDLTKNGETIFTISRSLMVRLLMFNHWYHHRGQLSTYLRILGVDVPSVYGPSADEDPFA
jgi:uncharacterized damage-inducible protein DinB